MSCKPKFGEVCNNQSLWLFRGSITSICNDNPNPTPTPQSASKSSFCANSTLSRAFNDDCCLCDEAGIDVLLKDAAVRTLSYNPHNDENTHTGDEIAIESKYHI